VETEEEAMAQITDRVRPLCLAAAGLVVSSELLRLAGALGPGQGSVATSAHTLTYGLALAGSCALLLALTALYFGHQQALGRLGLVGYLTAALGTVLVAGDWWFEAFAVPMIATQAPDVLSLPPGGSLLVGAAITVVLFAGGWTTFGVAVFRSRVASRAAATLLVAGGALGVLALSSPYQVPLAIAVGWIGCTILPASVTTVAMSPSNSHNTQQH